MALGKNFQERTRRVEEIARSEMVALMCTEADPLRRHGALLVAHELDRRGH